MEIQTIDSSRIQSMMQKLKAAAAMPSGNQLNIGKIDSAVHGEKVNFADALKSSLDQISGAQNAADNLSQKFALGDDSVNLSDVMIATQKASISFQAGVQVRNKLVTAYQDVMSMQI